MFRTPELAKLMTWHSTNSSKDNVMRIPADSPAFKHIDQMWPDFKFEPRNLKLGVGLDGVNPFSMQSSKWSTWPVIIINYNLPPYLGIKKEHLILSLLIPGKRQVKDINVYLAPLIDDLKNLWKGINVIDISKPVDQQAVTIRGILAWTIHDYPAYGFCSGLGTKGYKACPPCGDWLRSSYSKSLNKNVYLRHRRFLPEDHPLRMKSQARHFDGKIERGKNPIRQTPQDWHRKWTVGPLIDIDADDLSDSDDDRRSRASNKIGMEPNMSIWFTLEYWQHLKICHLLDPMHIFKNVGHSLWKHLIGLKDTHASRASLVEYNSKPHLWSRENSITGNIEHPKTPWVLTPEEISILNIRIRSIRTPTGHGASLRNIFTMDDTALSGLKTHDWHNFLKVIIFSLFMYILYIDIKIGRNTTIFSL
jgi:hypothetical protein